VQHPAHLGAGWAIEHARAVLGGRGAAGAKRLYLSRADAQARQVYNETELLAALADRGFEAITPATMSLEDQLAAFRVASHVVAAHGPVLTNIVLCPPGARVLELFHPLYGSADYAMLAAGSGLDYTALCGRDGLSDAPELNDPGRADFGAGRFGKRHLRVDPAAVRQWLEATA
jgi:capsular polysaccharide biosynthesis protein